MKSKLGESAVSERSGTVVAFMTEGERDAALALATRLRSRGEKTKLELKPMKAKKFFSRAGASAFAKAVFIGPDDVASGVFKAKNLADGTVGNVEL